MANGLKSFKEFILGASPDSNLPDGPPEYKRLIKEFYAIVSKPDYTNDQVINYLREKGYEADEKDLRKIANLHNSTKWFWRFDDEDY